MGGTGAPGGGLAIKQNGNSSSVGRKGRDIDNPCHLGIGASFGRHDTTIRVADQDDFARSGGDGTLRHGDVVGQRRRRVLDDGHVITVLLEEVIDPLPSGPISSPF